MEEITLVAASCALVIGTVLGMLGGGGAILTVPAFVYIIGFAAKPAIAMTLPIIGITSFVSAMIHLRRGNLLLRVAGLFGIVTMIGAFAGAKLSIFVPGRMQLIILSCVMIASSLSMFRSAMRPKTASPEGTPAVIKPGRLAMVGLGVGLLTGLVGIGGGFLIVPALVVLAGIPMRQAVGTSLFVISLTTAAGYAGYAQSAPIPWMFVLFFAGVAVAGSVFGAWLSSRLSTGALKIGFAALIIVIGISMLLQNLLVPV